MFMLLLISSYLHMMATPAKLPSVAAAANSVREILCPISDELGSQGSATVIGKNMVLTDYHVIHRRIGPCKFNGSSPDVRILYVNPDEDIVVLAMDTADIPPVPISCKGMIPGTKYFALGYPGFLNDGYETKLVVNGEFPNLSYNVEIIDKPPVLGAQILVATSKKENFPESVEYPFISHHLTLMLRNVYEGMSGGPILDKRGRIVGLITSEYGNGISANRDLKGTGLCR